MGNKTTIIAGIWLLLCAAVFANINIAKPTRYVEDRANVMTAETRTKLEGLLQELEQKTGAQYIVLTVDTTGGVPMSMFTIELAERWQLGREGVDDGMLFVLAVNDREYRFEVGFGLESVITDTISGRVGRQYIVPNAQRGDFGTGIYLANAAIANLIAQSKGVELSGMPDLPRLRDDGVPPFGALIAFLPFIIVFLIGGRRGLFLYLLLGGVSAHRRSYGRSSGFSGGSFGGGFGSFGGGGGGRFGGGGAGGRW